MRRLCRRFCRGRVHATRRLSPKEERGIALIVVLGVLAILSALGVSFAFNQRLEHQAAYNFLITVKAKWVAIGGAERAVAIYRNDANSTSFMANEFDSNRDFGNQDYTETSDFGDDTSGSMTLSMVLTASKIYDVSGRIYLNDTGNGNLDEMLQALGDPPMDAGEGLDIVNYRNALPASLFLTTRQVSDVSGLFDAGESFSDMSPYVTSFGYVDPATNRGPINVNTAGYKVLLAVFQPLQDAGDIGAGDAASLAAAVIEYRDGADDVEGTSDDNPFDGKDVAGDSDAGAVDNDPNVAAFATDTLDNDGDGAADPADTDEQYTFAGGPRGEFNAFVEGCSAFLTAAEQNAVKENADPQKDSTPVARSTEFCFYSKLVEVTSTGKVTRGSDTLAEARITRVFERQQ